MKCKRCDNLARRAGLCDKHWRASPYHGYVIANPTKEHLLALHDAGWSWDSIAEATGITPKGLYYLRDEATVVQAYTARVILDLPLEGGTGMVATIGSRRRIQALAVLGWPRAQCGARLGIARQNLHRMMERPRIFRSNATAIDGLFRELSMTPGPSLRTREAAKAAGWIPPLGWWNIDDPNEVPDLRSRRVLFTDQYQDMHFIGLSQVQMLEKLGCSAEALARRLLRYGIPVEASLQSLAWAQREGKAA